MSETNKDDLQRLEVLGEQDTKKRAIITKIGFVITSILLLIYFIFWIVLYTDSTRNVITQIEYNEIDSINIPVFMIYQLDISKVSSIEFVYCGDDSSYQLTFPTQEIRLNSTYYDGDMDETLENEVLKKIRNKEDGYYNEWVIIDGAGSVSPLYNLYNQKIDAILIPPDKTTLENDYPLCVIDANPVNQFLIEILTDYNNYTIDLYGDDFINDFLYVGATNNGFWLQTITRDNFLDGKMNDASLLTFSSIGYAKDTNIIFDKVVQKDLTTYPKTVSDYLVFQYGFDVLSTYNYVGYYDNDTFDPIVWYYNHIFFSQNEKQLETIYITDALYQWTDIPSSIGGMYSTIAGIISLILTYLFFGVHICDKKTLWQGYAPHEEMQMEETDQQRTELHLIKKRYVTEETMNQMLQQQKDELEKEFNDKIDQLNQKLAQLAGSHLD